LSKTFGVDYNRISSIPTLTQAGCVRLRLLPGITKLEADGATYSSLYSYAIGILLISPLGDLVRRRSLVLLLISMTATLSIGLAVTNSLAVFEGLSFIIAALTVTPQIMIPLTADLAHESKRGAAIAITLSGLMLGILVARVLSGRVLLLH
jgi:MFS family permease